MIEPTPGSRAARQTSERRKQTKLSDKSNKDLSPPNRIDVIDQLIARVRKWLIERELTDPLRRLDSIAKLEVFHILLREYLKNGSPDASAMDALINLLLTLEKVSKRLGGKEKESQRLRARNEWSQRKLELQKLMLEAAELLDSGGSTPTATFPWHDAPTCLMYSPDVAKLLRSLARAVNSNPVSVIFPKAQPHRARSKSAAVREIAKHAPASIPTKAGKSGRWAIIAMLGKEAGMRNLSAAEVRTLLRT